ncbi:hypothetical protein A3709_18990 [Halioglobus sp. HI00S01]|nr:hypothetical protein A3709_18990 [Halioglobus sp. HI00S01]
MRWLQEKHPQGRFTPTFLSPWGMMKPSTPELAEAHFGDNPRGFYVSFPEDQAGEDLLSSLIERGMPAPHPQYQYVLHNLRIGSKGMKYLAIEEQITEHFSHRPMYKPGQVLVAKTDLRGADNCLSQPRSVEVPMGTRLSSNNSQGSRRGDYFLAGDGIKAVGFHPYEAYVPCPYGLPLINTAVFDIEDPA